MDDRKQFSEEVEVNIVKQGQDISLHNASINWLKESAKYKHTYMFTWLGVPIIQLPQDIVAMQEIIWETKPDLIIETGIARGGSVIFYSSMLELLGNNGKVIGIDIDIRAHNRQTIESHPMSKNIHLIEGSSTSSEVLRTVDEFIKQNNSKNIMVVLDSDHTKDHVLEELRCFSSYVKKGSYIVVFDTTIEDMPEDFFKDRHWGKNDNPKAAVHAFLTENDRFEIDKRIDHKLLISVSLDGYLKCVK